MIIFIYIIICIIGSSILFSAAIGFYISRSFIDFPMYTTEYTIKDGLKKGEFNEVFLEIPRINFTVKSDSGYSLSGIAISGNSDRTIVFIHGVSWTWYGMVKYFEPFIKNGWNIIACDLRAHGESGGSCPTYGFYEKYDLIKITDMAMECFPETELLGYFGESMGGAITLQYLPLDSRINFAITDSAFSSMPKLIEYHIKNKKIPALLNPIILFFSACFMKAKSGFTPKDISPADAVTSSKIPILFIHGKEDILVPYAMAIELYEKKEDKLLSKIFIQSRAGHSQSVVTDRKNYMRKIEKFLDDITASAPISLKK